MSSQHTRPRWWQAYLTLPLLVALFVMDSRLRISTRGHQVVQVGIILLIYGLIHVWLKANATALSRMDREQDYRRVRVVRISVSQLPESSDENSLRLQLQNSESKGMLSDTFEMDYIDAEFLPVDEIPQELKKE